MIQICELILVITGCSILCLCWPARRTIILYPLFAKNACSCGKAPSSYTIRDSKCLFGYYTCVWVCNIFGISPILSQIRKTKWSINQTGTILVIVFVVSSFLMSADFLQLLRR